jgi:hypothetical protein
MVRILFLSLTIVFVSSLCFAQEASAPASTDNSTISVEASSDAATSVQASSTSVTPTQTSNSTAAATPTETATFTGTVDLASSLQIIVKDDNGIGKTFKITSDTIVIDKDENPTNISWITNGDKVSIEYTTAADGIKKTAKSIKVLASW